MSAQTLPRILNKNLDDIVQGEPFKLEVSGCDEGCTLVLATFYGTGENKHIVNNGSWEIPPASTEYTFTLNDLDAGDYWFYLKVGSHGNRFAGVTQSPTFHLDGESKDKASNAESGSAANGPTSSAAAPESTNNPQSASGTSAQATTQPSVVSVPSSTTTPSGSTSLFAVSVAGSAVGVMALLLLLML